MVDTAIGFDQHSSKLVDKSPFHYVDQMSVGQMVFDQKMQNRFDECCITTPKGLFTCPISTVRFCVE